MAQIATPVFGRRGRVPETISEHAAAATPASQPAPEPANSQQPSPGSVIADLRTLCLSRLDPAAVTLLPPDILIPEVGYVGNDNRISGL